MTTRMQATASIVPTATPALNPGLFVIGEGLAAGVRTTVVVGVVAAEVIVGLPELGKRVAVSGEAATEGDEKDGLVTLLLKVVDCDLTADVLGFADEKEPGPAVSLLLDEPALMEEHCPANAQNWSVAQHIDPHSSSPELTSQTSVGEKFEYAVSLVGDESSSVEDD